MTDREVIDCLRAYGFNYCGSCNCSTPTYKYCRKEGRTMFMVKWQYKRKKFIVFEGALPLTPKPQEIEQIHSILPYYVQRTPTLT